MSVSEEYLRLIYLTQGEKALTESRAKLDEVAQSARRLAALEQAGAITCEQFEAALRAAARAAARLRAHLAGLEQLSTARAAAPEAQATDGAVDQRSALDAPMKMTAITEPSAFAISKRMRQTEMDRFGESLAAGLATCDASSAAPGEQAAALGRPSGSAGATQGASPAAAESSRAVEGSTTGGAFGASNQSLRIEAGEERTAEEVQQTFGGQHEDPTRSDRPPVQYPADAGEAAGRKPAGQIADREAHAIRDEQAGKAADHVSQGQKPLRAGRDRALSPNAAPNHGLDPAQDAEAQAHREGAARARQATQAEASDAGGPSPLSVPQTTGRGGLRASQPAPQPVVEPDLLIREEDLAAPPARMSGPVERVPIVRGVTTKPRVHPEVDPVSGQPSPLRIGPTGKVAAASARAQRLKVRRAAKAGRQLAGQVAAMRKKPARSVPRFGPPPASGKTGGRVNLHGAPIEEGRERFRHVGEGDDAGKVAPPRPNNEPKAAAPDLDNANLAPIDPMVLTAPSRRSVDPVGQDRNTIGQLTEASRAMMDRLAQLEAGQRDLGRELIRLHREGRPNTRSPLSGLPIA